jgi:plasmid stabilization system protein ParE
MDFPRRGPRVTAFDPQEVREYRVDNYVLRYEVTGNDIVVLRFFHAREDRL